ncbi:hypothetical protein K440DRAFT_599869 [Wilcoxina mikolae CBS 423.85]|nr:hypothetical protein K440DRAFT_599869 [Wilcoxina mikolae CBS 423.85]
MPRRKGGLRCKLCSIQFATASQLHDHARVTPNHSLTERCDCDSCNPKMRHLDRKDFRRMYRIRQSRPMLYACEVCECEIFVCAAGKRKHSHDPHHRRAAIEKNLYCSDAGKAFLSKAEFDNHQRQHHQTVTQYHCIDCATDFPSQCALRRHPKNDEVHGKRNQEMPCDDCGKIFQTRALLAAHIHTARHQKKAVRCLAYPTCPRKFTTKGGMMAHLESGACRSKINRKRIDDLIRQHDTSNVILNIGAGRSSQSLSSAASPTPSGTIEYTELPDADSDDEGTIIFSPASSATVSRHEEAIIFSPVSSATMSNHEETIIFSPVSSATMSRHEETSATISLHENFTENAVIPTPSCTLSPPSTPRSAEYILDSDRVCFICGKEFGATTGLQSHLNSLAHAPRIYHCPTFLFTGATTKPQKDFKSISGLVMHLESGACEGGKEGLRKAMGYVEEKLNGMGMGHLLLQE